MESYLALLRDISTFGDKHEDRTGVGTQSVFGRQLRFDLSQGFPLLTTKKLPLKVIAEELFWFLSGSTDNTDLQNRLDAAGKPIKIWDDWATKEQCERFGRLPGDLGPVYGHAWRNFGATFQQYRYKQYDVDNYRWINRGYLPDGIDQIKNLCHDLEHSPRSRRLIVNAWSPAEATKVAVPPCHAFFQLKWHEESNKLDCHLYQRSCDVFLGVPFNIASYALLTHLVAAAAGMVPGEFIHTFGDVHIYTNHREAVNEQLSRAPRALPRLRVERPAGPSVFERLMAMRWDHLELTGYDPHPAIKAAVAV